MNRPVLIDEMADGPCEICASWNQPRHMPGPDGKMVPYQRKCNRCARPVGFYENMSGSGFSGIKPHHLHLVMIGEHPPVSGREGRFEELCWNCYLDDFEKAYPGKPKPRSPRRILEPDEPLPMPRGILEHQSADTNGAEVGIDGSRERKIDRAEELAGITRSEIA